MTKEWSAEYVNCRASQLARAGVRRDADRRLGARSVSAPNIRVSTRLVQIGIIVRDKNGPVVDLTKDDFAVLDRGRPQKISIFARESVEAASPTTQPLPANTFSDLPQANGFGCPSGGIRSSARNSIRRF
jgi:hypothetical protein